MMVRQIMTTMVDVAYKNFALHFKQDYRKINFEYAGFKIPLKTVRTDLQLKSTFFSLEPNANGDTIVFKGRGFGHGIGMCQEATGLVRVVHTVCKKTKCTLWSVLASQGTK